MPVSIDPRTTKSYRNVAQFKPGTIIQYKHYVGRDEITEFAVKRDDGTWSVAGVAEPIDNENFYYRIGDINLDGVTVLRALTDEEIDAIEASFSLDLLDIGSFTHATRRPGGARGMVYRPGDTDAFDRLIAPTLTFPEWVSVTGGLPWSAAGQYDRHNLLATELGLRAAEYLPVGTVLGEKYATVDLLAGTGLGKTVANPDQRRADGVIVRPDGLRIAFEITATASKSFENKIRRWAQIINERPLETSGLVVLFVAAPHPDRSATGRNPRQEIYRRLASVLRSFPGTGEDSPAARIGVVSWDEWFPARHELSEAFLNLQAGFALADGHGPDRWVPRNLLADLPFTPWHTFDATAVIENAPLLGATPHWLRSGDHTRLLGTPMSRAGEEVPQPPPVRPDLGIALPVWSARGMAGDARLPRSGSASKPDRGDSDFSP
jgi:hypothetical protein